MSLKVSIEGLVWTEENEDHVERHIAAWEIEELIEGGDFFVFPNARRHPPNYRKFIGRTSSGLFVTAILEEPVDGNPTLWRPVTGWRSDKIEREIYFREQKRLRKKQGKKYG